MTLKEEKRQVVQNRRHIGNVLEEKREERDEVRKEKKRKQKRDPKLEEREQKLDREIKSLLREEDALTKRIKELDERDDELAAKEHKLEDKIEAREDRKPDFNGHPTNVNDDVKKVIAKGNQCGCVTTSTTDGSSHSSLSWHYPGNNADGLGGAADMGGSYDAMVRHQQWAYDNASKFREVIGPRNDLCVKNGVRYTLGEGSSLENAHDNHTHIAPYPGALT